MKKLVCLLISILLVLSMVPAVFAASSASAWATKTEAKRGDQVTVYVNLSTTDTVSGLSISVGYDTNVFEFESASWTVANQISSDFDSVNNNGVVLLKEPTKPNGEVFCITLRVKSTAPLDTSRVSFNVKVGSDGQTVLAGTDISISCKHEWGAWKTVTEATCTEIGVQERVCSICGSKQQSYIDAKGHDYSDWQTTKEATCTESGEQVRKCSVCGSSQARSVQPKGHVLGDTATVIKEATCTEHGEAKGTCTVCGQEVTVSTPLAAHSFGEWYTIVQATCTEKGEREHECTVCGYVERQKSLPLGHDFSHGTEVSAATIYSTGLFEAKCSRCGIEGSIISPCSYTDEETHIYLETEEDVFPEGTLVKVKTLNQVRPEEKTVKTGFEKYLWQVIDYFKLLYNRLFNRSGSGAGEIKDYGLGSLSSAYDIYEIKAVNNDGDRTKQDGLTSITFPIPEGFGRNLAVYAIDENGTRTDLPVSVDMEKKTVKASSPDLYIFALANLDAQPEKNDLKAPAVVHWLIEGLLFIILIISWIVSGKRRRKIKEYKKAEKEGVKETEAPKETKKSKRAEKAAAKEAKAASEATAPKEDTVEKEKAEDPAPDNAASDEKAAQTAEAKPETAPRRPSSLRDEINEALGVKPEVAETKETPEPDMTRELNIEPEKSKKPTLDEIFGEKK